MTTQREASSTRTVSPPPRESGLGLLTRVLLVVAVIGAVLLMRFDSAVAFVQHREVTYLVPGARLAEPWPVVYVVLSAVVGGAIVLFLWLAFRVARAQEPQRPMTIPEHTARADELKESPLLAIAWILAAVSFLLTILRAQYADWSHTWAGVPLPTVLTVGLVIQVFLFLLGIITVARTYAKASDAPTEDVWQHVRGTIARHRPLLIVIAFYIAAFTVLPIVSEQTADALRLLSVESPQGISMLAFLLVTSFLVSAVTKQSWIVLDRAARNTPHRVRRSSWLIAAAIVGGLGVVAVLGSLSGAYTFSFGLVILGVMLLLAGAIAGPPDTEDMVAPEVLDLGPSVAPAYIAAAPLVGVAAAIVAALFDLVVVTPAKPDQLIGPAIAAILLLAMALLMTRRVREVPQSIVAIWLTKGFRLFAIGVGTIVVLLVVLNVPLLAGGAAPLVIAGILALEPAALLWATTGASGERPLPGAPTTLDATLPVESSSTLMGHMRRHPAWLDLTVLTGVVAGIAATAAVHFGPIDNSRLVGTVALINAFAALLVALAHYLSVFATRFRPPLGLEFIGFQKMPVLTFVLVWWVLAGLVLTPNLHGVRLVERQSTDAAPTFHEAFDSWLDAQPEWETDGSGNLIVSAGQKDHTVPLVVVASHGGGIRAAYWTALVMDCMVDRKPGYGDELTDGIKACAGSRRGEVAGETAASRVFLASGVSGGGVGLAAYSLQLADGDLKDGWVEDRLKRDLLAPVVGWGLFHDLPNHLLGFTYDDRASILEQEIDVKGEIATYSGNEQLRDLWSQRSGDDEKAKIAQTIPLLVINSSLSAAPYRSTASPVDFDGDSEGTADVVDSLCNGSDLRVSTAAVLGARFPIISPSGTIQGGCAGGADQQRDDLSRCSREGDGACALQMVDGGYLDNSGMTTIANLWPELQELVSAKNSAADLAQKEDPGSVNMHIAIVVVDIDNEYVDSGVHISTPKPEGETLLPLTVRLGGADAMQETGTDVVKAAVEPNCYVPITPQRNPGITAPLGWALSEASRESLRAGIPARSLVQLQTWLGAGDGTDASLTPLEDCIPTGVLRYK